MTRVHVIGVGMTPHGRTEHGPEELATHAALAALRDAGIAGSQLGLVVVSNALGGLLCDQECIRGQAWLRWAALGTAHVVNVDNGCAGGGSALHVGYLATLAGEGPVLVLGVEKMWTGDRSKTLDGIENCLTAEERPILRETVAGKSGSVFMGLNARWANHQIEEYGHTVQQFAATAVKARHHGSLNPLAQHGTRITAVDVLTSPTIDGPLTRLMCSSFSDGAAAVVLAADARGTPTLRASVVRSGDTNSDYHARLSEVANLAYAAAALEPADLDVVELHDATSAEELYALECLGFFAPGDAGEATLRGDTTFGTRRVVTNPSGGLVARGHPIGATGVAQVVEVATQLRDTAGHRQVDHARLGMTVNTGGIIADDVAAIAVHLIERT